MKCKKYKEKIILNLYGELTEKEREELDAHIKECPECSKYFVYTKKVFKVLDDAREEAPEANWEKCWQGIGSHAYERSRRQPSFLFFSRWVYAAAALLVVFVIGAIIGRFWFSPSQEPPLQPEISQSSIEPTLIEFLEDLKPVLVEYANYTSSEKGEDTIIMDKEVARSLLIQNLLLKSIVAKTNPLLVQFLEDVDIVLREVSNLKKGDKQTPSLIKELIHEREILFKMEIFQTKTI